ncbi:MAG: hypothetical protein ABIH39_00270, partial [Candidatus Margulisiibacteriota bacterium]
GIMKKSISFEIFPLWVSILSSAVNIAIYAMGAYILFNFGWIYVIPYLLYCLWVESRVLKGSCADCYYYGKNCGGGKGKVCAVLYKKGDPEQFVTRCITWKDIFPDFFIAVIPLLCGMVLLYLSFSIALLMVLTLLFFLYFAGNAMLRGTFACRYCKQRELGCPAGKVLNKKR